VLQKKATLGSFANENLNPTGDKKFLLSIWLGKEHDIFICIYLRHFLHVMIV
jgi:hypothetical protein